jgi:hypothetical protein
MKAYIVLIPVSDSVEEPRNSCETIENIKFDLSNFPCDTVNAKHVLDKVMFELGINESHNIEVEPITDFMDRVNNEEFNVDDYFMSYVYA